MKIKSSSIRAGWSGSPAVIDPRYLPNFNNFRESEQK